MAVVISVGLGVAGPVEEEESVEGVVLVLNYLDNQLWIEIRRELVKG